MRAWGAGRRRGRRERRESVETWALALTEASPRIARLHWSVNGRERCQEARAHKPTMSSWSVWKPVFELDWPSQCMLAGAPRGSSV